MHFQFLIEDRSGETLIRRVMEKICAEDSFVTFDCKSFKGIGGLKMTSGIKSVKKDKLLNDLHIYLEGLIKA